jgi:hypothetical protein
LAVGFEFGQRQAEHSGSSHSVFREDNNVGSLHKVYIIVIFEVEKNKGNKWLRSLGGVVQWSSHQPEEHNTRDRIPPGCKVFEGKHSNTFVKIELICIACLCDL